MSQRPESLPHDVDYLLGLVADLREELAASRRREEKLLHELKLFYRKLFGRKSERLNPDQLALVFTELANLGLAEGDDLGEEDDGEEEGEDPPAPAKKRTTRRRQGAQGRFPDGLRRIRKEYPPSEEAQICSCCRKPKKKIGEEISSQLELLPAELVVIEHVRITFGGCGCDNNLVSGKKPAQPLGKGLPGPGLLAFVLISKYADHLPLHRLEGIFERLGMRISRKTMCDWVAACALLFQPIFEVLKREVLAAKIVHTDDTSIQVLDRSLGATRKGRIWVYSSREAIVYDYTPSRERDGPVAFLGDFSGYLQADAYAGYDGIYAGGNVIEVACWMHARRKFYEASETDTGLPFTALAFIRQLFDLERKAKAMSAQERQQFRKKHAIPVLAAFKQWLDEQSTIVLPQSPLAKAMGYCLRQWDALIRYTDDGELAMDNGEAERQLRPIAVGRKNWLFAGSDEGGRRAATILSLIGNCRLLGIDPLAYLKDVLERLPTHPTENIAELTPRFWAEAQKSSQEKAA